MPALLANGREFGWAHSPTEPNSRIVLRDRAFTGPFRLIMAAARRGRIAFMPWSQMRIDFYPWCGFNDRMFLMISYISASVIDVPKAGMASLVLFLLLSSCK